LRTNSEQFCRSFGFWQNEPKLALLFKQKPGGVVETGAPSLICADESETLGSIVYKNELLAAARGRTAAVPPLCAPAWNSASVP